MTESDIVVKPWVTVLLGYVPPKFHSMQTVLRVKRRSDGSTKEWIEWKSDEELGSLVGKRVFVYLDAPDPLSLVIERRSNLTAGVHSTTSRRGNLHAAGIVVADKGWRNSVEVRITAAGTRSEAVFSFRMGVTRSFARHEVAEYINHDAELDKAFLTYAPSDTQ